MRTAEFLPVLFENLQLIRLLCIFDSLNLYVGNFFRSVCGTNAFIRDIGNRLHITRTYGISTAEPELLNENRRTLEDSGKDIVMLKTSEKKESSHIGSPEGYVECPHQFGYLGKLPKKSSIPEECYSCSRMMHCLFLSE